VVTFIFVMTSFKHVQSLLLLVCAWLITGRFKLSGMKYPACHCLLLKLFAKNMAWI